MQLPFPVHLLSSLLRERLLLMNGAAARDEPWRDEKLRLLLRRAAGPAERDLVPCWPMLPLFKVPPALLPLESLPLPLRLLLLPKAMLVLDVLLPACLPPLDPGAADAAKSFWREETLATTRQLCMVFSFEDDV